MGLVAQQPLKMDTLQWSGRNAIDMLLMGDGYTADPSQQAKFGRDARAYTDSLFSFKPFSHYRRFFNVYALHVVSEEDGVSHPGIFRGDTLWCKSVSKLDTMSRRTFFGTTLDCAGIHRLTNLQREDRVDSLVDLYCPGARQLGVIVNSEEYGGSGGRVCVATCERRSHRIFIHELAHSFADLADEYFAGDVFLGEFPNQSMEGDPEKVRWHRWLGVDGVGVFPYKGSENAARYYKPTQADDHGGGCMMELLAREFCPVCREALVQSIHRAVRFASQIVRKKRTFTLEGVLRPEPNTLHTVWTVDGKEVARDVEQVTVDKKLLKKRRPHTVEAIISDTTWMVRGEPVTQRLTFSIE